MGNSLKGPGVLFYHLKGKFSLANSEGQVVSKFKYEKHHLEAIQDFLAEGKFEGMFDILPLEDYKLVLALHYDKVIADASNRDLRAILNREYERKLKELEDFHEQSLQVQPE